MTTPNIPPGYRAFDAAFAKAGGKTFTRDGQEATIVEIDLPDRVYPFRFKTEAGNGGWYDSAGRFDDNNKPHPLDLFHPIEQPAQWPAPIAFKDRMPTAADANKNGYILIADSEGDWRLNRWSDRLSTEYNHWLPQPPAPQSAEDAEFEAFYASDACPTVSDLNARVIWDAALAFARKGGK